MITGRDRKELEDAKASARSLRTELERAREDNAELRGAYNERVERAAKAETRAEQAEDALIQLHRKVVHLLETASNAPTEEEPPLYDRPEVILARPGAIGNTGLIQRMAEASAAQQYWAKEDRRRELAAANANAK